MFFSLTDRRSKSLQDRRQPARPAAGGRDACVATTTQRFVRSGRGGQAQKKDHHLSRSARSAAVEAEREAVSPSPLQERLRSFFVNGRSSVKGKEKLGA